MVHLQEGQEWFKIARELIELGAATGETVKWDAHFFRYGTVSLWSELVRQQGLCAEKFTPDMTNDSIEMLHFIDQWQVILRIADYVDHQDVSNVIYDVVTNGIRLTLDFLQGEDQTTDRIKRSSKSRPGKSQDLPDDPVSRGPSDPAYAEERIAGDHRGTGRECNNEGGIGDAPFLFA